MISDKEELGEALTQLMVGALQHLDAPLVALAFARFAAVAHLTAGGTRAEFCEIAGMTYDSERQNQARAAQQKGLG